MSRIVWPGPARITLALLLIVPAAMAYPWRTVTERWVLGVAVVVVILLLIWWRGRHLTTILGRRLTVLGSRGEPGVPEQVRHSATDATTAVALKVLDHDVDDLPTELITGYLNRYGIRSDAVRITTRETALTRDTWISITVSAVANLAALQGRSAELPLVDTAEVALRRLADQLREAGWQVSTSQPVDVPDVLGPQAKQRWRAVADGEQGYIAAYGVAADDGVPAALAELRGLDTPELWTVQEFTTCGSALACAVRTTEQPGTPPLSRLEPQNGRQFAALSAMHPLSTQRV